MMTILHISDLHRSQEEPVDNQSLLASLIFDRDRYMGETPKISDLEAIIVSGDLIQGASVDAPKWKESIKDQYKIAGAFLTDLCQKFLDGDKSRIVLTPGNHDVCWNTSYEAMQRVPTDEYPSEFYGALVQPDSSYRWSWSTQELFQITDQTKYAQRMDSYWDFVESFYDGVDLLIPIDRTREFQLFELCNQRILVASFDSVYGNDCFATSGAIARGAVGKCAMQLRDAGHTYDMKIAVWHHGIQGPPIRSDYMDISCVQEMIGYGFQLGLHGHQHVASTSTQFVHLDQSRHMAIVGAGSLCAGAKELPRGVNRQYNLIVIEDNFLQARVHVREMGDGKQFTRKRDGAFLKGYVEIDWQPLTDSIGGTLNIQIDNIRHAIDDAEIAVRNGRPSDVAEALNGIDLSSQPYARKLMIDALLLLEDWTELINILETPATAEEVVLLISAFINSGDIDAAQRRLAAAPEIDATTRASLQEKLETKKIMRRL